MIIRVCVLCTIIIIITTCSPVVNKRSRGDAPYGYAPYVWVSVSQCTQESGWCVGRSKGSFALTVNVNDRDSGMCTHYCPGDIYATWKSSNEQSDVTQHEQHGVLLGAYVYRLDRKSCVEIPGGFPCSDRVVSSIPINKVSIMLHASPNNREYFFGDNPLADCDPGPQCAAYKFLRRTLYAAEANVTWPNTDDVLTLRNSPYDCVLTYAGLGDSETIGLCYMQLGDKCFRFSKTTFCIGKSQDTGIAGLTNADENASAPIAMCEISGSAEMQRREPLSQPTTAELSDFISPSSCDATVVSVDNVTYGSGHLFVSADIERFHVLSELGHVILSVPVDECLLPMAASAAEYSTAIKAVAETLHKTAIATYSSAIMIDASEWGTRSCTRNSAASSLNLLANNLALATMAHNRVKMFLRLPRTMDRAKELDFGGLASFEAFVTPRESVNMGSPNDCQNMWTKKGSTKGLMPYLLTILRSGVKANKLITTLSLTGGIKITPSESNGLQVTTADLTLADAESNTMLKCEEDINTKCCSGSTTTILGRNTMVTVAYTTTSLETLKQFPELIASAFGINQFMISPVDSDFKRNLRSNAPAVLSITSAVHRLRDWRKQQAASGLTGANTRTPAGRVRRSVELLTVGDNVKPIESVYKDPASGSKNVLDPQYQVGLRNKVECPGLIATNGAVGVFKEPYVEMFRTAYDKIYIANVHQLASCTPGEPAQDAERSEIPPDVAINVHTLVPTSDSAHFMVGILNNNKLVQYSPPVNKVCNTHNSGEPTHRMNIVAVDDGYVLDKPKVEAKQGVIVKPAEAFFIVSNFSYGVDYMNLNVQCINYDVSAMQPCLIAICGGDSTCRKDYGKLCNSAHEIVNDARRASQFVKEGLEELAAQEMKAMMYKLPEDADFDWMTADKPKGSGRTGRKKRFLGIISGVGGLAVAWHTSNRVDKLEEQMDLMKNNYVQVTNQLVEVSSRLDENIALVNTRMDDHEKQMKRNADFVNRNFAVIKDSLNRNTEMLMRDINTKFSVMTSYQMWYAQMQSVTHQMTQASMQVRFIARGVENCLRQIASKRSGSCPSGMTVLREHPGLAEFPTVSTALYKDRKLFIVHSLPGTVEKTTVRSVIPMPKMSTDGIPCWPDYTVWAISGRYYEPADCHGKYCYEPKPHSKYMACLADEAECKTVCTKCHRGICYENNKFTWMESTVLVSIDSPPLKPFSRPHISDGPITFEDLMKDSLPGVPQLDIIKAINTSVKLVSVKDKLQNISDSLTAFDERYEEITAARVSLGGWLSGLASNVAIWTSLAVLMAWCTGLSAALAYAFFCGGGGGGGGGGVRVVKHARSKGYSRKSL